MMLTPSEKKILRKIADSDLATKNEIKEFMKNNGVSSIDSPLSNLVNNQLISVINPIGSTCYIITRKGSLMLKE